MVLWGWQNRRGGFLTLTPESGRVGRGVHQGVSALLWDLCGLSAKLSRSSQSRKWDVGCDCGPSALPLQDAFFHFQPVIENSDLEVAFCHLGFSGFGCGRAQSKRDPVR